MPAVGFKVLTQEQVDKLRIAEGSAYGGILAELLDNALNVALGELPTNIPQSSIVGLTAALAAKQDAAKLVVIDSAASAGGSATESMTFTGLVATDTILSLTPKTAGANDVGLRAFGAPGVDTLSVTFSGDPGAGAVVRALVRKV